MNELHGGLATVGSGAILHGHEDSRISGNDGIVDDCTSTSQVMEGLDGEVRKIAPMLIKAIFPVENKSINDGGAIELRAKSIKDETCVHRERFQSCPSNLECMSALVDRHGGLNLGIHGGQISADLNCHHPMGQKPFHQKLKGLGEQTWSQERRDMRTLVMEHHLKMNCRGRIEEIEKK